MGNSQRDSIRHIIEKRNSSCVPFDRKKSVGSLINKQDSPGFKSLIDLTQQRDPFIGQQMLIDGA